MLDGNSVSSGDAVRRVLLLFKMAGADYRVEEGAGGRATGITGSQMPELMRNVLQGR